MKWFAASRKWPRHRHSQTAFRVFGVGEMPWSLRWSIVRQYGNQSLSYATAIQPGLRHFGNDRSYIAYQQKWGFVFVLGDPVCCASDQRPIVAAFLRQFPNAAFCQVQRSTAEILQDHRFWINQLGIDTRIDLAGYDFQGKQKERFRYASNWLARRGYRVEELPDSETVKSEVEAMVLAWRQTRTVRRRETAFLNRPLDDRHQPDMRRFYLVDADGRLQAFVYFDPLYQKNRVIGYVTSFKRRLPGAPSMAEQGICKAAIERFREEGRQVLRLGLSPLAELQQEDFRYNWVLRQSMRYGFQAGWLNRYFYNVQGHAAFKSRFRGIVEKTWFASPTFVNDIRLVALMRLCRIL